ncbi:DUF6931 family protein [Oceaniglobus roseus]|uniref:DUF6931 family protein n=1 Tax=Oceaniglobus roseus TaxID=1737570 RepID=UPI000C7F39EE|nr:hypothetical protein [Kandeliimicrobium roseum]
MDERFQDLRKIPKEPARRLMALANLKFETELESPAAASVSEVLEELDGKEAYGDMLRLLAVSLPVREAIWWGCLAGGDLAARRGVAMPPPLAAARAWVFKPTPENREKARATLELAESDDDTTLCANAVAMCDGKLGAGGEMAKYDAPVGGAAMAVLAVNAMSLGTAEPENMVAHLNRLIDRALDIARGGNGQFGTTDAADGARPGAGDGPQGEARP